MIDEIQRQPKLFEVLRPLADGSKRPARFLILGSASPELVRGVSESLAGRVGFVDLGGFDLTEVGAKHMRMLWLRGGLPRSYLARNHSLSFRWRRDFARTFLERAWIVYPGKESYPVHRSVEVVPLEEALGCLPSRDG